MVPIRWIFVRTDYLMFYRMEHDEWPHFKYMTIYPMVSHRECMRAVWSQNLSGYDGHECLLLYGEYNLHDVHLSGTQYEPAQDTRPGAKRYESLTGVDGRVGRKMTN